MRRVTAHRPKGSFCGLLLPLLGLVVSDCATVPITGRIQLLVVSNADLVPGANQAFGRFRSFVSQRGKILSPSESPQAEAVVGLVNRVSERLLNASGLRAQYAWEVMVVKASEAGAFVLPNGKIVVFTGLLPITKTEAGLAAVVGHEIGHVMARHAAERLSQALLADIAIQAVNLGLALSNSKYRPIIGAATGLGIHYGILLPFSRAHELEADHIGLFLMAKAGYHPAEAVEVWRRMAARGLAGPWEFLSTHPSAATREAQLREWIPDALLYFADATRPLPADLREVERLRAAQSQQAALVPIAPRPSFLPGYWWRVQRIDRPSPITERYVRQQPCSDGGHPPGTCFVVESESGSTLLTEDYAILEISLTDKPVLRMSPAMKMVEWPLRLGQVWSQGLVAETQGKQVKLTTKVEVVAYEPVTTPAGQFMAFKLVQSINGKTVLEYWYAPEVRNLVRSRTPGWFGRVASEMVDYQKTNEPVVDVAPSQ